ncbi:MAG: hypothetical protein J3K34DRAFT_454530 [Monoraphidium minutum]|nr:MAG: hypothetical protein J3K34DRAFT_454530 [Monoraphidium minutum]
MGHITERMIRSRAEHNEGLVATLEEVALHQQNIERIELLGQLCPRLRILYLQNNLIPKIENLHKLKDLSYLNLAVNNITKVQNLQRCESLSKLDLTVNFVPKAGLLSLASLAGCHALRELFLMGNPCADWHGYRQFVVGSLPQLARLDGRDIPPSERIAARQALPGLLEQLRAEVAAEGGDPDAAAAAEDDGGEGGGDVAETGVVDEGGEMRRPWCPATRILEHREAEKAEREAQQKKAAGAEDPFAPPPAPPRHEDFPPLAEGEVPLQRNEGKWEFRIDEDEGGRSLLLEVQVGRYVDTSLVKADVRPRLVRLLVKGRLLQLVLPEEVCPDASTAQRSKATGALLLTMPKEAARCGGGSGADAPGRPKQQHGAAAGGGAFGAIPSLRGKPQGGGGGGKQPELRRAAVVRDDGAAGSGGGGDDDLPDL